MWSRRCPPLPSPLRRSATSLAGVMMRDQLPGLTNCDGRGFHGGSACAAVAHHASCPRHHVVRRHRHRRPAPAGRGRRPARHLAHAPSSADRKKLELESVKGVRSPFRTSCSSWACRRCPGGRRRTTPGSRRPGGCCCCAPPCECRAPSWAGSPGGACSRPRPSPAAGRPPLTRPGSHKSRHRSVRGSGKRLIRMSSYLLREREVALVTLGHNVIIRDPEGLVQLIQRRGGMRLGRVVWAVGGLHHDLRTRTHRSLGQGHHMCACGRGTHRGRVGHGWLALRGLCLCLHGAGLHRLL
jgi:hypothetical protein